MRFVFALVLVASLGACSSISNPRKVYLRNAASGEIVKCEQGAMDNLFNALEICVKNKEKQGFSRLKVSKFDRFGYPLEYEAEKDPFWPENH